MKAIQIEDFSKPVKVAELPIPKIGPNQVLVKHAYSPINPMDVHNVRGGYGPTTSIPRPFNAGFEASGEVVEAGKDLQSKFKPGDKVYYFHVGSWAEYAAVNGDSVHVLPEGTPIDVASCAQVNPMTVHCMLLELQAEGHKSVVHTAGSSALGRMFIRVMKEAGIKTVNLVRNADYIKELKEIGADYVLNTQDENFEKDFKEITASLDCRKAYDAICGDFTGKLVSLMPRKSNISVYGLLSGDPKFHVDFFAIVSTESTVTGFVVTFKMASHPKEIIDKGYQTIFAGLKGAYASHIQKVFKFEDVEEAIKFSVENASKGKVLLSVTGK
eukprot:CAMPEP_0176441526 /NCGR_PEP_ID=MMETSP0127-20121128/21249_1 /TAXON_ID=938130 /ORGANISM="Platyophrya macrostoma, Strain WH" /LENGTH=327 /DNA_ID=CAMNT_0017826319 /DNA_START=40 /DNA_END=1023 /DNA_ORIENTATION=-